ncbi:hypothetical protein [Novilysobacter antarcticus]|uniref:hypothetical protein n=1 Tax=Novilysobacter antarcticus TaxID=2862543 RepID=UPI001C993C46|nr:hypothetical protein [Lysobacter antarcticus]
MVEAIERDGYIIAQAVVPEANKRDIRMFIMNGYPLQIDGMFLVGIDIIGDTILRVRPTSA